MKRLLIPVLLVLVIAFGITHSSSAAANEWRWAKPLNQKPGSLLYTTNVRAKASSQPRLSQSRAVYPPASFQSIRPRRLFTRVRLFRR